LKFKKIRNFIVLKTNLNLSCTLNFDSKLEKRKTMKKLILFILATLSLSAFSDHHESAPMTTDGAFTTLMIAASDINKYTETLRENPSAFQATGTTGAGVCVTNSGMTTQVK
jgi:hypothetical protein